MSDWSQFGRGYDHPIFEGQPRTYLIASTPRSGSHLLGHMLFETGAYGSPLEYFHPEALPRWQQILGTDDLEALVRKLFRRRTSPSGWFGVKAHWTQFAAVRGNEGVAELLAFKTYIRIVRRDVVAQAVSLVIARQSGAWNSLLTPEREPSYDFDAIHHAVSEITEWNMRWDQYFEVCDCKPILVEYETLIVEPNCVLNTIGSVLTLDEAAGKGGRRIGPRRTRQSTARNAEWKERYLADRAAQGVSQIAGPIAGLP